MSATTLAAFIARCRFLCRPRSHATDAELLRRFTHQRDADAFAQLLERYACLVWSVCRRILARESDCEDAFQATFLALLRRPDAFDSKQSLGAWLHTIAVRVAHRTLTRSRRQQPSPGISERATTNDVAEEVGSRELFRIVDEEIERLPTAVRAPLILCCLEGRTRDEAAEILGCSVSSIKGRLERGRQLLRRRLERRGVELPAAFLVLGLTGRPIRAAVLAETMQAVLHTPPAAIISLAEAALPALTVGKGKLIVAALIFAASTAGLAGTMLMPKAEQTPVAAKQAKSAAEPEKPHVPQVRTDRHGDPLPDGAIARLGTVRWRHGDFVHALAYSPDGKMIATTGVGRALVLWDAATGKEQRLFPSRGQPRSVAFSPDGKRIATDYRMGQVWDVSTGKLLWERKNVQSVATAVVFSPDGKTLATANSDKAVRLWDTANDKEPRRIDCGQGYVNALAYSPDGKLLAAAGEDGTIRLWDAATGKEARGIRVAKKAIRSIAFSPDGEQLAAGCDEEPLSLWDTGTGRQIRVLGDKQVQFSPVAFSPDGKLLAAGYGDGTFRLWDAASGEEKRRWRAGAWRARSLAFSPDGKTLATAALWDGGIRLWDVATGQERNAVEGHYGPINLLRFTADKKTLISAGLDRNLLEWDLATQTPQRRFAWTTESFSDMALSPDGNIIAAGDHVTYEVWLWDVRTGKSVKLPGKHQKWIQSIAFSPDGKLVASGGRDDAIHVWQVHEAKEVRQIKGIGSQNSVKLLFLPDGKTLACGTQSFGGEVTLHLWDVASGKERRVFDNKGAGISPDAFSPDGKVLATASNPQGSQEAFVRLVDMTTGKELCRHGGHRGGIGAVAFSPDGKLVVSGCVGEDDDNSIHVWEAATGRLIRRFEGHHSWVFAVTFAADGLTVASSAGDTTVLVWDITDRQKDDKLRPAPLTPRQLEACWKALADEEAAKAYDAVWSLVATPEQAVPFLRKHLPPMPRADEKNVARLIADLDSDDFKVRQKSVEELGKFGDAITPALQLALDGKPSLEVRRRLLQLLDRTRDWTPERLRPHRAIQALEHMNTIQARQVLQVLADGVPGPRRTEEARAALRRIGRSPAPKKH